MLNARTSASVNQIGYTIFPYINHKWKTKYVIYPRSADRHYTEGQDFSLSEPERIQNISLLTMNEKLSMLHIPEVLRHYTECQDFSLGELERIHNISLSWPRI